MIRSYEVCEITPRVVREIFDACVRHPAFQAGICCSSFNQLTSLREVIEEIEDESPPWYVEQVHFNINGMEVRLQNGSRLDIFAGNESSRGKRFHCLRVDSATNENLQQYVLRYMIRDYMIRDYQFANTIDGDEDSDLEDLLAFAEAMLGRPLHHWQRDMLMSMLGGYIYVPGRSIGKAEMLNVFKEWKERPQKTYTVDYTYDSLMEGVSV